MPDGERGCTAVPKPTGDSAPPWCHPRSALAGGRAGAVLTDANQRKPQVAWSGDAFPPTPGSALPESGCQPHQSHPHEEAGEDALGSAVGGGRGGVSRGPETAGSNHCPAQISAPPSARLVAARLARPPEPRSFEIPSVKWSPSRDCCHGREFQHKAWGITGAH